MLVGGGEELASNVEVVFGGYEVDYGLVFCEVFFL